MMASAAGIEGLAMSEFSFSMTPGGVMNSRFAGGAEALMIVTDLPSASRIARSPSSEPSASASGLTWLVMMNEEYCWMRELSAFQSGVGTVLTFDAVG